MTTFRIGMDGESATGLGIEPPTGCLFLLHTDRAMIKAAGGGE